MAKHIFVEAFKMKISFFSLRKNENKLNNYTKKMTKRSFKISFGIVWPSIFIV